MSSDSSVLECKCNSYELCKVYDHNISMSHEMINLKDTLWPIRYAFPINKEKKEYVCDICNSKGKRFYTFYENEKMYKEFLECKTCKGQGVISVN